VEGARTVPSRSKTRLGKVATEKMGEELGLEMSGKDPELRGPR
jgi:hypothetical protein